MAPHKKSRGADSKLFCCVSRGDFFGFPFGLEHVKFFCALFGGPTKTHTSFLGFSYALPAALLVHFRIKRFCFSESGVYASCKGL